MKWPKKWPESAEKILEAISQNSNNRNNITTKQQLIAYGLRNYLPELPRKRHIYLRLDRYVLSVIQRQMRREAELSATE